MATLPRVREISIEEALGLTEVAHVLGVHPRTIERRKTIHKVRRPLEFQRKQKLQEIWRALNRLFTPDDAVYWLRHPVPALENRRPLEVMAEDGGLDRVLDAIGRMSWGIVS